MIIYLALFVFLVLCHCLSFFDFFAKHSKLKSVLTVWIPIFIIILLSTLKGNTVGRDTKSYLASYNQALESLDPYSLPQFKSYEIGFRYLFLTFAKLKIPFRLFQLFIYSTIYIIFGFIIRKESRYPSLTILLFSLWSFLIFNFSGLRQAMSDMFAIFSLFVITRKPKRIFSKISCVLIALLLYALSILLHSSSILFGAMFLLYGIYILLPSSFRKITIILTLFVPLIFLLNAPLYEFFFYTLKINYYIPTKRYGVGELFYLYYAILIFAIIFSSNNKVSKKINNIADNFPNKIQTNAKSDLEVAVEGIDSFTAILISAFLIGTIVESFASVCFTMTRIANPFLLTGSLMIPNIISLNRSKKLKILSQILVVLIFALVFYIDYYKGNYLNGFPFTF